MISVIMPTYNRARTLKRAIDSVLAQTYSDIELIVVDDCSTDNTKDIIDKYSDERLRYVRLKKNSGACVARNVGIEKAKGEYIAFQDSDDYWEKEKIEQQIRSLRETASDLNFCRIEVFDGANQGVTRPNDRELKRVRKKGMLAALCDGNFISTQAIFGKAECFGKNGCLFDENLPRLQDFDICLRLSKGYKWSFCDKKLVRLYVQGDSVSRNNAKMIRAVDIISNKDYGLTKKDGRKLRAHLYEDVGNLYYKTNDYKCAKMYYRKSLQERKNIKVFCKVILSCRRGR
ncbi:MAG: glycosyltransferase family 2 protein [Methanobrevibacter sp.]|nr:glycosyltransferase family 2 protein [Methanobrevibacter sp.]